MIKVTKTIFANQYNCGHRTPSLSEALFANVRSIPGDIDRERQLELELAIAIERISNISGPRIACDTTKESRRASQTSSTASGFDVRHDLCVYVCTFRAMVSYSQISNGRMSQLQHDSPKNETKNSTTACFVEFLF